MDMSSRDADDDGAAFVAAPIATLIWINPGDIGRGESCDIVVAGEDP
jgi:hypothetical protein